MPRNELSLKHPDTHPHQPSFPLDHSHPYTARVNTTSTDKGEDDEVKETITRKNKDIVDSTSSTKGQILMQGTKAVFQVQYEPSLTSLLQPSIRTTRLSHKDYKAPVVSEASKDSIGEGGKVGGKDDEGHEMEVDEGALKREEDKKASVRKQTHAAKSKAFHPPMKRDKKGESHGGGGASKKKQ